MKLYLAKNQSIKFSTVPEIVGNGRVYTRHQTLTAKLCGEEGGDELSQFDAEKLTSLLNNAISGESESENQELSEENQKVKIPV